MQPRVISFDCAQTLLDVRWDPRLVALDSAKAAGLVLDEASAGSVYERLLQTRWRSYENPVIQHSEVKREEFWRDLTADWLTAIGQNPRRADDLIRAADQLLYRPDSEFFRLYDDVIPCLDALKSRGQRMVVVSNWDGTLEKTLQIYDLNPYFEAIHASMMVGSAKPDRGIFELAWTTAKIEPGELLHIGDNPIDDVQGALAAGVEALLIDRRLKSPEPRRLARLTDLFTLLD